MQSLEAPSSTIPVNDPEEPPSTAYAQLTREIKDAGLLRRRSGYYVWKIAVSAALWAGGWIAFVMIGNSWWQIATAVYFAIVFTQLGFMGHDAGHRQIFGTRSGNLVIGGLAGNLAVGLSYGWWVDKHNRHHAHPNDEERDPDVGVGAFVFTTGQASAARGIARWFYRYQAYSFFPLLLLEAINLRVASVRYLIGRDRRYRIPELVVLTAHIAGYLTVVFLVLSPVEAIVFIVIHQCLFGLYLGCSFAPNHKGMPPLSAADERDFLRRQVLTSRNVDGGWLTDFAFGGLNYQIEHHLFPSMPRPNLRHAQRIVRTFCEEQGVAYRQTGVIASYTQALRHLNAVGRSTLPNIAT